MTLVALLIGAILTQQINGAMSRVPVFLTEGQEWSVFAGDTVEIQCAVKNLPSSSMVFWLNGSQIITSGRDAFVPDNRLVTIEGNGDTYNLKIRNVNEWDDGQYSCQVPSGQPITQNSRLTVKKPPSIHSVLPGSTVRVRERERLRLECRANGRPRPSITWTRQDKGVLPDGQLSDNNDVLTLNSVSRNSTGVYICKASNGVGSPASQSISVVVQYGPIVNATLENIYSGPSHTVSIECITQSEPEAQIIWYHNNSDISIDLWRRKNIKKGKQKLNESTFKHLLEITNLYPRDLGMYKCEARNDIGFGYKVITVSAHPYDIKVLSKPYSYYMNEYTLQWQVFSYTPVLDFTLFVKQINETWDTPWIQHSISAAASARSQQLPLVQEHQLSGLVANSEYHLTIKARNSYGECELAEEFRFRTSAVDITTVTTTTSTTTLSTSTFKITEPFAYPVGMGLISSHSQPLTMLFAIAMLTALRCF